MKKKQTKIIGVVVLVLLVLGIGVGIGVKKHMDDKAFKEEMIKIVFSDEGQELTKDAIEGFDSKAFKEGGTIKQYKIDKKSIEHNPMGGIDYTVIINNDSKFSIFLNLDKEGGNLKCFVGGSSGELSSLLSEDGKDD